MEFNEDWTKEEDNNLKEFHECDWEEACTMCHNFYECKDEHIQEHANIERMLWPNDKDGYEKEDAIEDLIPEK